MATCRNAKGRFAKCRSGGRLAGLGAARGARREYEVIVGNIGTVYSGGNKAEAERTFNEYVRQSRSGRGRAAGESVTLTIDGEPVREHYGEQDDHRGLGATAGKPSRAPARGTSHYAEGTWIEPEEMAYTARAGGGGRGTEGFSGGRRARARVAGSGGYRVVNIGLPDTYFSIPVKGGGYVSVDDGVVVLHGRGR